MIVYRSEDDGTLYKADVGNLLAQAGILKRA